MSSKILRSKLSDVEIPNNVSLPDFLLKCAEQFGHKVAMVCIILYVMNSL